MAGARRLVLVTPDAHDRRAVDRLAALLPAFDGVADLVILRWPHADAATAFGAAVRLRELGSAIPLLLRDRLDVARAAGLAGVQLPEGGFDPAEARLAWPGATIGVSRHDVAGVRERGRGADFALVAPVRPTSSKPGHPGMGMPALARIVEESPVEVVALGGLDEGTVGAVLATGVGGIAVRSAVFGAADPVAAARGLRAAIDSAR